MPQEPDKISWTFRVLTSDHFIQQCRHIQWENNFAFSGAENNSFLNRIPDRKKSRFVGFPEGFLVGWTDFPISGIPEISGNVASLKFAMSFTWTNNVQKSSCHDRNVLVIVKNELRSLVLQGSCGLGLQIVWCGVIQHINSWIPIENFRTPQPITLRLNLKIAQLWVLRLKWQQLSAVDGGWFTNSDFPQNMSKQSTACCGRRVICKLVPQKMSEQSTACCG